MAVDVVAKSPVLAVFVVAQLDLGEGATGRVARQPSAHRARYQHGDGRGNGDVAARPDWKPHQRNRNLVPGMLCSLSAHPRSLYGPLS